MRRASLLPAIGAAILLAGCSTVSGGPPRVADQLGSPIASRVNQHRPDGRGPAAASGPADTADQMMTDLVGAFRQDCFRIPTGTETTVMLGAKARRDQMVKLYMVAADQVYFPFETSLMNDSRGIGFIGTIASLGLATAGSTASGHTARVLAAANAGVIGERTAFTREYLFDKTVTALQNQMRANRATVAQRIYAGLAKPVADYSACDALRDLLAYEQAGTLADALIGVAQTTSDQASAAQVLELQARDLTFATSPLAHALRDYFGPEDGALGVARVKKAIAAMPGIGLRPPDGMTPGELFGRIIADDKLVAEQRALAMAVLTTETDVAARQPIVDALK